MFISLCISLFVIFTVLGLLHVYWLFGGTWGINKVIPTKPNQEIIGKPPAFATLLVALILFSWASLYLLKAGLIVLNVPTIIEQYAYWIIPSLFILRAIGEFKYVGFFKKIISTEFAKADSCYFSPLSLLIGILGILIAIL